MNDTLRIEVELSYITNTATISLASNNLLCHWKDSECELRADLIGLLESGSKADLVLVVSDNTEFAVHKSILVARCPVLAATLGLDGQDESLESRILWNDFQPEVARLVLRFIYGTVPSEDKVYTAELFKAADKVIVLYSHLKFISIFFQYQLDLLKQICEQWLVGQLSTKTVIDILILGDTHHSTLLKAAAIDYISRCVFLFYLQIVPKVTRTGLKRFGHYNFGTSHLTCKFVASSENQRNVLSCKPAYFNKFNNLPKIQSIKENPTPLTCGTVCIKINCSRPKKNISTMRVSINNNTIITVNWERVHSNPVHCVCQLRLSVPIDIHN